MLEEVTNIAEYELFVSSHPRGHFMQSSMWAKQKPEWTWRAIISRDGSGRIRGSLAVLIRPIPGFCRSSIMYGCRGPIYDIGDDDTLDELLDGVKELAKTYRCYTVKLDPDITGEDAAAPYTERGFSVTGKGKGFEGVQPRFVFRLDIGGRTEDSLLASFDQKTRYNIRLAERRGVEVRICGREAVADFHSLMTETGRRDGFSIRNAEYFSALLDNLGNHVRLYMAYYQNLPIAGTIAICYADKVWYLYGASSNLYRNLMPNYLLQWRMIQWALEKNCRVYDFRGVSGNLDPKDPLYGLYRFKKGFNGEFTEFIGELDYVRSPATAMAVGAATELRRSYLKLKSRLASDVRFAAL